MDGEHHIIGDTFAIRHSLSVGSKVPCEHVRERGIGRCNIPLPSHSHLSCNPAQVFVVCIYLRWVSFVRYSLLLKEGVPSR